MRRPPKPKRKMGAEDRLGSKKDGLRWPWKWPKWSFNEHWAQNCWHGGPGYQVASAEKHTRFGPLKVESVNWNDSYEGLVELNGDTIATSRGHKTRIESQRAAEKLIDVLAEMYGRLSSNPDEPGGAATVGV